jgi:hypothetical protein
MGLGTCHGWARCYHPPHAGMSDPSAQACLCDLLLHLLECTCVFLFPPLIPFRGEWQQVTVHCHAQLAVAVTVDESLTLPMDCLSYSRWQEELASLCM